MESHVLNTYHQARYRSIGHKRMGSTSESLSSESSCTQNSPEYPQPQAEGYQERPDYEGEYWRQNVNTTQTSQETSSDEEDNIEVVDVDNAPLDDGAEDTLVEGDDYDVIQVYTVHPDLDLEASSDDEQPDYAIANDEVADTSEEEEYDQHPQNYREETQYEYQENRTDTCQVGLDINLDGPVVSNVDEYFIKENPKPVLDIKDIKDEPVVKDVDEYFIKGVKPMPKFISDVPNVDDFFVKEKAPKEPAKFDIVKSIPHIEEVETIDDVKEPEDKVPEPEVPLAEVSINESDLDVLPNIEDIKRYLLEDMSYNKFKNSQRSFSVPHSPMHHIACMDIDDAKTCLSFEDLNLDLSDLAFENDKDKSDNTIKSYDLPRTLTDEDVNSFLITNKVDQKSEKNDDDFSTQDMEIEHPVESTIKCINEKPSRTSTPIPKPNVLDFCIEKPVKLEISEVKVETDDFVDVESCNDAVIPVLAANNLNSLLEQFEANEKFATKPKRPIIKEEPKAKSNGLTNGMRLQDAGVQLNKNKMRQILMPPGKNTALRRSPSPVRSDHDYCSTNKRHSLPTLKGGQSLLKPEVLSSNSRILNSRHRSCKNKKIVYHLSSDDESDRSAKNKKATPRGSDDSDIKAKKSTLKQPIKPPTPSNCRKKLSPPHSANDMCKDKINNSVMVKNASKASDTLSSQTNISIKLTIKNKSEVILNNCDQQDVKDIEKCISSVSNKVLNTGPAKVIQELDSEKNKCVNSSDSSCSNEVQEESRPKEENFYTALFTNKQDVQVPQSMDIKSEKRPADDEVKMTVDTSTKSEIEQPMKKKKLNLQEYKLRRSVTSNNSSAAVSPEAIFPDLPSPCQLEKVVSNTITLTPPSTTVNTTEQKNPEEPKKLFDPIREASRKILMNTKKHKAEAMRKRDEDIVMSKIPKVENLELQPLISDAEMLKIVGGMAPEEVPAAIKTEKPKVTDYEELVLVSVGTNTEETVFRQLIKAMKREEKKSLPPPAVDAKALINFKIKKSEPVLKQNVFEPVRNEKRSPDDKRHQDVKIDKERYKDITAALKSVKKQVDTKISSNSLFASIQDVVLKKAPEESIEKPDHPTTKQLSKPYKTIIVREYDPKADHGEDKIILHLGKHRRKPHSAHAVVQTDKAEIVIAQQIKHVTNVQQTKHVTNAQQTKHVTNAQQTKHVTNALKTKLVTNEKSPVQRKRNDSDMSMSSDASPSRSEGKSGSIEDSTVTKPKEAQKRSRSLEKRSRSKDKQSRSNDKRSRSRDKRSRSRGYDRYRRRSRSRSRRRRRSRSRSVRARRSRSTDRYRRRKRDSPYRKRTRSPYRRRSPSNRRDYRNRSRSRSRSRHDSARSKSPTKTPPRTEKKCDRSFTPPLRKTTISESSDSSTSSSSSSSSSSSGASRHTPRSCSPRREEPYRRKGYRSYSPEDRDSNKPVEERRIVFVGKLEKDSTKASLRATFSKFGHIMEVRLHNKEDGTRYGFVTYERGRDAWSAVEASAQFPQYDVGFGGRRAFCRQSYADLDGLEAEYTESAFHGAPTAPSRRNDMSFEQMLLDVKQKLSQRKKDEDKP